MLCLYRSSISGAPDKRNQQKERRLLQAVLGMHGIQEKELPLMYTNDRMSYLWFSIDSVLCQETKQAVRASKKGPKF